MLPQVFPLAKLEMKTEALSFENSLWNVGQIEKIERAGRIESGVYDVMEGKINFGLHNLLSI